MIRDVYFGSRIQDPNFFYLDLGVNKAPDPRFESGSATLLVRLGDVDRSLWFIKVPSTHKR
jgi:hypothetical protein